MPILLNLLLRAVLIAAGLVFALVLACAFTVLLAAWGLRAAWARLTGRPVMPFVMRMSPQRGFEEMMRRAAAQQPSRTPRADAAGGPGRRKDDVSDVQPR